MKILVHYICSGTTTATASKTLSQQGLVKRKKNQNIEKTVKLPATSSIYKKAPFISLLASLSMYVRMYVYTCL